MVVLVVRELRRSFAMSHLPYSYDLGGDFFVPFVQDVDGASGDSIVDKTAFSEGRGHYWLWKNVKFADEEFVSINQYRRCFWFPQLMPPGGPYASRVDLMHKQQGQSVLLMSRREYIDYVHFVAASDRGPLNYWIRDLDLVVCRSLEYPRSIAQIYGEHHRAADWEIYAQIARANGLDDGRHNWLTGHLMFIMRPDLFDEYMTLWWKVMQEVDQRVAHEDDPYQHRKIGFLTERFMSSWLIKKRAETPTLRVQTLPIAEGLFQADSQPGCM